MPLFNVAIKDFTKKDLIMMFNMNIHMLGSMTLEGRRNAIQNMIEIANSYSGKRGYGAVERQLMMTAIETSLKELEAAIDAK